MKTLFSALLVVAQIVIAISNEKDDLSDLGTSQSSERKVIAENLRVKNLDLVNTLHWDPVSTGNGREKQRYTVYYTDAYSSEPAKVDWKLVKNCVDVIETDCVIDVNFVPVFTYALWVTSRPHGPDVSYEDPRSDIIHYSVFTEFMYDALLFSAPRFEAYRQNNEVYMEFEQIRKPWWDGQTMADIVYEMVAEWPKNNITYFSCDAAKPASCTGKNRQVNYKLMSMEHDNFSLVTTVEDGATLCVSVSVVVDEHISILRSNATTMCFAPDMSAKIAIPFVISSGALLLLFFVLAYCFCRRNGKKICWKALKIRKIELPNTVDEILRERPNEMTFNVLLMDEAKEQFEPLSLRPLAIPDDDDVTTTDDVASDGYVTLVDESRPILSAVETTQAGDVEMKENADKQAYLKVTDLINSTSYDDDVGTSVTYSEVLSTGTESGSSIGGYITLTEHLGLGVCSNNNCNKTGVKPKHVCTSSCGYVEKDVFPFTQPCPIR